MAGPNTESPTKGGGSRWTEADKIDLLLRIIFVESNNWSWKDVQLPPGRTLKSCMHMMAKLKEVAAQLTTEAGQDEHSDSPHSPTPARVPVASGRKPGRKPGRPKSTGGIKTNAADNGNATSQAAGKKRKVAPAEDPDATEDDGEEKPPVKRAKKSTLESTPSDTA